MAGFVVGLTGGVASGKSAVAERFAARGIVVVDADVLAREVVELGQPALAEVVAAFGPEVLGADGRLDRAAMRARVFADPQARKRLEALLHPRIREALRARCAAAPGPYAIAAIPLLAETDAPEAYRFLDRVLVVDAPQEAQLERLMRRDGADRALALRMLAAQAGRAQRLAIADDVIVNDGPLEALEAHVAALDARYRRLAAAQAATN
ncbi:dephospho-CoA kinase [Vulcaniibacterium gelatinicum]|uniref:dephospho-CoA kinase n=1 Tax=Vulcaniibacterium gelatinicum TaxID=2598725 RepID=UPI0011C94630|nr:dephospho-CoA kinase [Vulcaniibacterium gelatinicum]